MRRLSIRAERNNEMVSAISRARRPSMAEQPSRIVDFYSGRSVLVTGASGFIGKLLIEKLLRSCPDVGRIFVLIRRRRNKSASERFAQLFDSPIFDTLRSGSSVAQTSAHNSGNSECPFQSLLRDKIFLLEGDLTHALLGLGEPQIKQLAGQVSVVLHSAALVSFEGNLRRSIATNLAGTRNVLELARRLPRLAAFVHVSTCYSNCDWRQVDEHIYPADLDPVQVINMAECCDDQTMELLKTKLLGKHPNAYTFTKQLAEYLVGQYALSARLPVLICRPSIVVSTLREPLVGFTDNRSGMNGIMWATSRGLLRTARGVAGCLVDQVPSDLVVNAIIALAWFAHLYHQIGRCVEQHEPLDTREALGEKMANFYRDRKRKLAQKLSTDANFGALKHKELIRVPVCHVSSGVENPVSFGTMLDHVAAAAGQRYPSMNLFRKPSCRLSSIVPLHHLNRFFFHTLTGLALNWLQIGLIAVEGGARSIVSVDWSLEFKRVDKFVGVLAYFMTRTWHFNPETRQKLLNDFMNDQDRRLFDCDTSAIDWKDFADKIVFGMRKYILAEPEETIEEARARYRKIYWRNTGLQLVLMLALIQFLRLLNLF